MNETLKSILRPPYRMAKKMYHKLFEPKPLGYIFMLHRVGEWEEGKLFSNENMKISPVFLDEQLTKITEKFDVIKLTDVQKYLTKKQSKKFVVFTMDDGYKDNLTKALPVFKKHNVPFTIFVTTNFPDKKAILWWYLLEDLILSNDEIVLSNGITYPCKTREEKEKSFLDIRAEILKLDQTNLASELDSLFAGYKIDWLSKCDELCLSWDDIAVLKNEPLVEIAAHTEHHYNLKQLENEDAVCEEIRSGAERLKNQTGIAPSSFAYPFGSPNEVGQREFDCMKKLSGINLACIAYGGACNCKNTKNLFALPRIMFTMDFDSNNI